MNDQTISDERALLGAMIVTPDALSDALTKLKPEDFYRPAHQVIFSTISALFQREDKLDAGMVAGELSKSGDLNRVGGHGYIFELVEASPVAGLHLSYIERISEAATLRRLAEAGERIQQAVSAGGDPKSVMQFAQSLLDGASHTDSSKIVRLGDGLDATLQAVYDAKAGIFPDKGVMTGFGGLDGMTNGFKGGQMIIVAARPGVGKSTLAVDFMRHASINLGVPSLFFSLEMSEREIRNRILSAEATLKAKDIERGNLNESQLAKLVETADRIGDAPIFIDDSAETTMMDITAKTKLMVKKHGVGLVVIDYLQLLKSGIKAESRQQEVSDFSRQIKLLAKSCDVPIIAIAQLNRGVEKREEALPRISDLRESGSLEQDADIVLLVNRPDVSDPDHARAGEADLIIGKHRGGQVGTITVAHQMHFSRFAEMPREAGWKSLQG